MIIGESKKKEKWLHFDTNITPWWAESVEEFNEFVMTHREGANELIVTKGGYVSQQNLYNLPCCGVWQRGNQYECHYIDGHSHIRVLYALRYDENSDKDPAISWNAINYFKGIMDVIPTDAVEEDTELFRCPENKGSQYYNYVNTAETDYTIHHCYSLDGNSAFLSAMVKVYPETKPWADKFMMDKLRIKLIPKDKRTDEEQELLQYDKIIIGWLKNDRFKRIRAWKKIISESNRTVHELRMKIEEAGNTVLVVNTDAVKFIGKYDYQGDDKALGGFKYEWYDTDMYIKSVKSYAYKDGDKWKFKQAGKTKLDQIKPRDEWTLDDFKSMDTVEVEHIILKNGLLERTYH